ncbi:MAG: metalloregulator ArsR/SmtB family transcription factor [Myxococcota bacterium]
MLNPQRVDAVFHALGDPTRRAMLARLSRGPISVTELAEPFPMSLAAVVQHLQVLEESGVVRTEKVGRVRTCSIAPEGLRLAEQWLNERRTLWERRLDRLGALLAEEEDEEDEPTPSRKRKKSR